MRLAPCLLLLFASAASAQSDTSVFDRYRKLVEEARGLRFKTPVPSAVLTPKQFKELNARQRQAEGPVDPAAAAERDLAWKALGLIPRKLDVDKAMADDVDATTAGFYVTQPGGTHPPGSLVLIRKPSDGPDHSTPAHELLHALHDQHFGLAKLDDGLPHSVLGVPLNDANLASRALEEGVATMIGDQIAQALGQQGAPHDHGAQPGPHPDDEPRGEPSWLETQAGFPYMEGPYFAQALREHGGNEALNQAYADPPRSTEQILHPERYLRPNRDRPSTIVFPDLAKALPGAWEVLDQNDLGELALTALIGPTGATGWDGDRYQVLESRETGQVIVALHTTWDTPQDATEFRLAASRSTKLLGALQAGKQLAMEQRGKHVFLATGLRPDQVAPFLAAGRGAAVLKEPGDDDAWPARKPAKSPVQRLIDQAGDGVTVVQAGATPKGHARVSTLKVHDPAEAERVLQTLARWAKRSKTITRIGPRAYRFGKRRVLEYDDGVLTLRLGRDLTPPPIGEPTPTPTKAPTPEPTPAKRGGGRGLIDHLPGR